MDLQPGAVELCDGCDAAHAVLHGLPAVRGGQADGRDSADTRDDDSPSFHSVPPVDRVGKSRRKALPKGPPNPKAGGQGAQPPVLPPKEAEEENLIIFGRAPSRGASLASAGQFFCTCRKDIDSASAQRNGPRQTRRYDAGPAALGGVPSDRRRWETTEAPPAAKKARPFRGGAMGGPSRAGNRTAATVLACSPSHHIAMPPSTRRTWPVT